MEDQNKEKLETLISWRDQILREQEELRKRYQEIGDELSKKDSQLRNIASLLESAGYVEKKRYASELEDNASIADCAYHILNKHRQPLYYKDLTDRLLRDGILIPGKNAAANLLAHIGRDARFRRIKRGTYALSEWKIRKERKKRKSHRKSRLNNSKRRKS